MDNNNIIENSDAPGEEPPTLHTKRFRIGSGNIIGKVTQFSIILSHRDKQSIQHTRKEEASEKRRMEKGRIKWQG